MWRRLLGISVLISLVVGCNKYKPDPLEGELSYLVGTWTWDSTHHEYNWCTGGGTLEEVIYPEEYGQNFELVFDEKGCVSFFGNEVLLNTDSITINHFNQEGENRDVIIHLNGDSENILSGIGSLNRTRFTGFPFVEIDSGCEWYLNYFSKQ